MTKNSEKLENVAMVTLKSGIAEFQAKFPCERLVSDHPIPKQWISRTDHDSLRFRFQGNIEEQVQVYQSCSILYQMIGNFSETD